MLPSLACNIYLYCKSISLLCGGLKSWICPYHENNERTPPQRLTILLHYTHTMNKPPRKTDNFTTLYTHTMWTNISKQNSYLMVVFLLLVRDSSVKECEVTCTVYPNSNVKVTNGKVICLDVIL